MNRTRAAQPCDASGPRRPPRQPKLSTSRESCFPTALSTSALGLEGRLLFRFNPKAADLVRWGERALRANCGLMRRGERRR